MFVIVRRRSAPQAAGLAAATVALTTVAVATVVFGGSPAGAAALSGTYHAVSPTRILDTRAGTGAVRSAVAPGHEIALQVAPTAAVPSGATAAVLNVTVTAPTTAGVITVYPDGTARPATSNLNFVRNQTVPNLVIVPLGSNGKVRLFNNSSGSVQLVADVSGYFTGSDSPSGQGAFGSVPPNRLLDTRTGTGAPKGAVASHGSAVFGVTGGAVPAGVSAVVLNVTVTAPSAPGNITAYPHGGAVPTASNLNFVKGQTVPNLVVVPVGSDGKVALANNSSGTVQLVADIFGYFLPGDPVASGALGALAPQRLLDTRSGIGSPKAAVGSHKVLTLTVRGRGGVPLGHVAAVILNVTVTAPTTAGVLAVYAGGVLPPPPISNLNFVAGQTVPNLVVAPVSTSGTVAIFNNSSGSVQLVADVSGYVLGADAPLPATSVSRYVRNLTAASTDAATMSTEGCADAHAGSTLVLLDIGAQSNTNSPATAHGDVLSPANPGVRLTVLNPPVRLTYAHLVTALNGYTSGFSSCASAPGSIAIGTSNSGDFAAYPAATKGADWANQVMDALTARTNVTLLGADDIEASFGSTEAQASAWESAYLNNTTKNLVYNGSLDNCPTTYGSTADCGAVAGQAGPNWTRANYASLTHGLSPGRISVLPQVYFGVQAVQWANVDATAGGAISFAGALTEQASACGIECAMSPAGGWAALYHAISTIVAAPVIPAVTDLRIDAP